MAHAADALALRIDLGAADVATLQRAEQDAQRQRYAAHRISERNKSALDKAQRVFIRVCRRKAPAVDQATAKRALRCASKIYEDAAADLQLWRYTLKGIQARLSLVRQCHEMGLPTADVLKPRVCHSPRAESVKNSPNEERPNRRPHGAAPPPPALLLPGGSMSPVIRPNLIDLTSDSDGEVEILPRKSEARARRPSSQPQVVIDLTGDADDDTQSSPDAMSAARVPHTESALAVCVPIQAGSVVTPIDSLGFSTRRDDASIFEQRRPLAYEGPTRPLLQPVLDSSADASDRLDFGEDRSAARAIIAAGLAGHLRPPLQFGSELPPVPGVNCTASSTHKSLDRSREARELLLLLRDERQRCHARHVRGPSPAVRTYEAVQAAKAKRDMKERKKARQQHEKRVARGLHCCVHCTLV